MDELNLEHFSLDLANARERGMVIIKAFGKLRLWSMIQEARYWEAVRMGSGPGLEDAMHQDRLLRVGGEERK